MRVLNKAVQFEHIMIPAEKQFLQRNKLPESYLEGANRWFAPLVAEFSEALTLPLKSALKSPLIIVFHILLSY